MQEGPSAKNCKKNLEVQLKSQCRNGKVGWFEPYPLPHPLWKARDWREFCKMCLQNLEPKGVRGQNLENKEFGGATFSDSHGVAVTQNVMPSLSGTRSDVTRSASCLWKAS
jgi:hypothetical protein